jgi:plastocyanin
MAHCHIENHAANGMMTIIEYEGYTPTGPVGEFWRLTPDASGSPAAGSDGNGMSGTDHSMHGGMAAMPASEATQTAVPAPSESAVPESSSAGSAKTVVIAMEDDRFEPTRIEVPAGTTVVWENHGADWHSVAAFDGSFESAQLATGESFSYTFTTPGEYPFICKHHGRQGMIGRVIVTG